MCWLVWRHLILLRAMYVLVGVVPGMYALLDMVPPHCVSRYECAG